MFRRKEEGLDEFDTSVDNTQTQEESANESSSQAVASSTPPAFQSASRSEAAPAKPATASARPSAPAARSTTTSTASASNASTKRRILTVGNDILLKGEIATCDRLVIEGEVDAKLKDVHTVEIAETGSFKGAAHIQDAEISGLFEGELIVENRLIIYSTGKVNGKITYGEIEIERGGELSGEISHVSQANAQASKSKSSSRSKAKDTATDDLLAQQAA
jgi:cytoskeletal protein CcmA (bactofilin family)